MGLVEVLELTPQRFAAVFKGTAIKRVKRAGLLRNACVVAGNVRARECVDVLVRLAREEVALVRAHAVWAVAQIVGREAAAKLLAEARLVEADVAVLAEYEAWLSES
jgi:epoxyqueuosine reductase